MLEELPLAIYSMSIRQESSIPNSTYSILKATPMGNTRMLPVDSFVIVAQMLLFDANAYSCLVRFSKICFYLKCGVLTFIPGKGLKVCEANPQDLAREQPCPEHTPLEEIFKRTLAFYCTLSETGCAFDLSSSDFTISDNQDSDTESDDSEQASADTEFVEPQQTRRPPKKKCRGRMLYETDKYGRYYLRHVCLFSQSALANYPLVLQMRKNLAIGQGPSYHPQFG